MLLIKVLIALGVFILFIMALIDGSRAEDKPVSTVSAPPPAIIGADQEGLFDIDSSGTDIKIILEALARRSGANVVVSPDVTGEVTAHLKQKSLDAILDYLAAVRGFEWEKKDNTYMVIGKSAKPADQPAPPPSPEPETLIWRCKHSRGADLIKVVNSIFPECKSAVGPASPSPKLEEAMSSASQVTGGGGNSSSSSQGSSSSSSTSDEDKINTIVFYGDPAVLARIKSLLEKLDVGRPQIAIEVAITEISSSLSDELGVTWSWSDMSFKEPDSSGIKFGNFNKQSMTFTGTLAALIGTGNARLLAQPNISVLDGAYADILIGDRILYPKLVGYSQYGNPMYDKAEERVGIYLQIAPKIAEDDEIVMTLYPQVSLVTSYLKTQAGDYPQISTREARTTVSVRAGQTLAIGGLIQDNEIRTGSKIPLLGDLPIIGQVFKHHKTTKDRTEIVIFLTPRIVGTEKK